MTESYEVIAQSNPAINTDTDVYTVPAATQVILSSIMVCNPDSASKKFRIAIRVGGAALTTKQYIYYDQSIPATESFSAVLGITLNAGDVITVRSSSANFAFNFFGAIVT